MYHILSPQCHGQDSASFGENHPFRTPSAHSPRLVELSSAILAGIGSMDKKRDLTHASRILDPLGAVDEVACARLHAEAVESVPAERGLGQLAKISGDADLAGLEGALDRGLEFAFGIGGIELGAGDSDPGPATLRPGADVGRDLCVGRKREADQLVARRGPPREDAGPLRNMRSALVRSPKR
jgi:hypothetical protein